jgi:P4 family phage/plasmid primase-like protien
MTQSNDYLSILNDFLYKCKPSANEQGGKKTHTSFGPPWGGYIIPDDKRDRFMKIYCRVIEAGHTLHMIEIPREVTPLPIDIDFKYDSENREYTIDDVKMIVKLYNKYIRQYFNVEKKDLRAFVMEKEKPNYDAEKQHYRDGWHVVYPDIAVDTDCKLFLCHMVKTEVEEKGLLNHLKFFNKLDDVFDISVLQSTGWCMYGSRKHTGSLYNLTHVFTYSLKDIPIENFTKTELINMLSMHRYNKDNLIEINENLDKSDVIDEINLVVAKYTNKPKTPPVIKKQFNLDDYEYDDLSESDSSDESSLSTTKSEKRRKKKEKKRKQQEKAKNKRPLSRVTQMAKQLVEILSPQRADGYATWIHVGWALCNIDYENLYEDWIKFSKLSPAKFDQQAVDKIWIDAKTRDGVGYTISSLRLWARTDNPIQYNKIVEESLDPLFNDAISGNHYDIAKVIFAMYGDVYKCTSTSKHVWYHFKKHRWVLDRGRSLSILLSEEIATRFMLLAKNYLDRAIAAPDARQRDDCFSIGKKVQKIIDQLKTNGFKNSVLEQCEGLFFDDTFEERLDSYPHLIGFENGVYDLEAREFRDGCPDDLINISTKRHYREYTEDCEEIITINKFFRQVMTDKDMYEYLLTLISTYLDGTTRMQQLVIWTGGGGNGKSTVVKFFEKGFGDYCGVIPITVLTRSRGAAGAATPELSGMRGKRFGVFQEPEQDDRINVGYMKELTGGDRLFVRPLYSEGCYVNPQFSLLLTCNVLPTIPSTDDGTWRRLRVAPFESQFVDEDVVIETPKQFRKDRDLIKKMDHCIDAFMWYLINVWYVKYRKEGLKEPSKVKKYTEKWREDSDLYKAFMNEHLIITKRPTDREQMDMVYSEFKNWYVTTFAEKNKCPHKRKLEEYLIKNDFIIKRGALFGVTFKKPDDRIDDDLINEVELEMHS